MPYVTVTDPEAEKYNEFIDLIQEALQFKNIIKDINDLKGTSEDLETIGKEYASLFNIPTDWKDVGTFIAKWLQTRGAANALQYDYLTRTPNPFSMAATVLPSIDNARVLVGASPPVIWESPTLLTIYKGEWYMAYGSTYVPPTIKNIGSIPRPYSIEIESIWPPLYKVTTSDIGLHVRDLEKLWKPGIVAFMPSSVDFSQYDPTNEYEEGRENPLYDYTLIPYPEGPEPEGTNGYLARIERIKYAAAFFGRDAYINADHYFQYVWRVWMDARRKAYNLQIRPVVGIVAYSGMEDDDLWEPTMIPQAQSYFVQLVRDFLHTNPSIHNHYPGTGVEKLDSYYILDNVVLSSSTDILFVFYAGDPNSVPFNPERCQYLRAPFGRTYVTTPAFWYALAYDPVGLFNDLLSILHPKKYPLAFKRYFVEITPDSAMTYISIWKHYLG